MKTLPIRHGYTLGDLHDIARLAVHTVGMMGMDWHDRYDTAYSAIAEHLCAAAEPPSRRDLVRAGQLAIYAVVQDHRHHHGYYKAKTIGAAAGPGSSPAFTRYWVGFTGATQSCEERVVEAMALQQILATLTARQLEALAALGALDDYRAAAASLGIVPTTFRSLLGRARGQFKALWHEGESPSRPWGTDRRVGSYAPPAPSVQVVTHPDNEETDR